ncbi:MAG TPA: SDR family oxidoreductase [Bellilinea sp.]|nr:SDR family oxidoreductase [Bellilinea sp.]
MKKNYANQHILITGGSSGIGLACAKRAAFLGANVTILGRRVDVLEQAAAEIQAARTADTFVQVISADVSQEKVVRAALCGLIDDRGLPDVVINCAGITHPGEFTELSTEIFHWNMDTNYFGTVYILKTLVPGMIQRGSGQIVNISSIAGIFNIYGYSAYGASKYAINGLSEALRMELKPHGISVSLVIPADTNTPQLTYELQYKPEITKKISQVAGLLQPEQVAREIFDQAARGKYLILPGSDTKFLYALLQLLGRSLFYTYFDGLVSKALKSSPVSKPGPGCQDQTGPDQV